MGRTGAAGTWVRDGGQVLACIPNIQHFSVLVNLLRGQWQYQDEGLLDRTHLRFFTLQGVQDLFAGAGLHVFEIQTAVVAECRIRPVPAGNGPGLERPGNRFSDVRVQTRAVQYIVRAIRAGRMRHRGW